MALSHEGVLLVEREGCINVLIDIAERNKVHSLRGTAFYVLRPVATTRYFLLFVRLSVFLSHLTPLTYLTYLTHLTPHFSDTAPTSSPSTGGAASATAATRSGQSSKTGSRSSAGPPTASQTSPTVSSRLNSSRTISRIRIRRDPLKVMLG